MKFAEIRKLDQREAAVDLELSLRDGKIRRVEHELDVLANRAPWHQPRFLKHIAHAKSCRKLLAHRTPVNLAEPS